jgi:hypothetical protein
LTYKKYELHLIHTICYCINTYVMPKSDKNSKRERFERLAVYRTNEVMKRLKVLSNCANRSAYEYDEEDISKIFAEIDRRVKEARSKFHFPKSKGGFKL